MCLLDCVCVCVCVCVCLYLYVFVLLSIYPWKAKKEPVALLICNGSASYLTALCFVTVAPVCWVFTVTVWPLSLGCRLYLQEKTHSLWDWFKPAHSVCCCYSSQHFMEVWHYWSGVLICHCSASFPWPCLYSICHTVAIHPLGLSRWMELWCSRNHFCAGRLSMTSLLMILSYLSLWYLGWSKLTFQMVEVTTYMVWFEIWWKSFLIPESFLPKYQSAWDSDFRGIHFHVSRAHHPQKALNINVLIH